MSRWRRGAAVEQAGRQDKDREESDSETTGRSAWRVNPTVRMRRSCHADRSRNASTLHPPCYDPLSFSSCGHHGPTSKTSRLAGPTGRRRDSQSGSAARQSRAGRVLQGPADRARSAGRAENHQGVRARSRTRRSSDAAAAADRRRREGIHGRARIRAAVARPRRILGRSCGRARHLHPAARAPAHPSTVPDASRATPTKDEE